MGGELALAHPAYGCNKYEALLALEGLAGLLLWSGWSFLYVPLTVLTVLAMLAMLLAEELDADAARAAVGRVAARLGLGRGRECQLASDL